VRESYTREIKMDDYMFRSYVQECKCVTEATSYLEILNYSVSCSKSFRKRGELTITVNT